MTACRMADSLPRIAFNDPSNPEEANRCHEGYQHLAKRDGILQLQHYREQWRN
jgi:hypothetical protein